tara:strand:+ start:1000 stop:1605 length:606 start_codon:yes stop_codon:yes gene_type:complete
MAKMTKKKDNNLLFWESVQTTDPNFTKEVGFGRKFTSINAQYQIREVSRAFGRIGQGWGITSEHFWMVCDGLLAYQAILWYMDGDNRCEYNINSSIATHNGKGKLDDECFKKVSTDALTKGISKLGFNADVFLGMWDDNRYVTQVRESFKTKVKLTPEKLSSMIDAISSGKGDIVKSRMGDYDITKAQSESLKTAFDAVKQ